MTKTTNTTSPFQNLPKNINRTNNMSIPEYIFSSTILSSWNNSDPILLTRLGTYKLKTNKNRFDSNCDCL